MSKLVLAARKDIITHKITLYSHGKAEKHPSMHKTLNVGVKAL